MQEQHDIVLEHYNMAVDHYGENRAPKLMRKHLGWYTKGLKAGNEFRKEINSITNHNEVIAKINNFYDALK